MDTYAPTPIAVVLRRLLREPRRPAAVRESPRAPWLAVGTVCIGAFMGQLDVSIVTLALPHIGAGLHAGPGAVRWVALSYLLMLTGTLVAVGFLADRVGRKLLYTYGFAVFTLGSALCGLAPDLGWLIGARLLQGLGAAMLQANSVALIAATLPRRELARGIGIQGAAQASGLALGPIFGGLLLALGGWRLIFLVNLPVGLLGLALSRYLLPRTRFAPTRARRVAAWDRRALALGLTGAGAAYLVMFGALYVIPYYLAASHVPVALAGLQLAALPVALGVAAPLAGRLSGRIEARVLAGGGLLLCALGLLELAVRHGVAGRTLGLALAGAGLGVFIPINSAGVMNAAPRERAGALSGILNTTRGLGTALGVAIAGLIYVAAARPSNTGHPTGVELASHGLTMTLLALAAIALAAAAVLLGGSKPDGGEPGASGDRPNVRSQFPMPRTQSRHMVGKP
ncbi:MAG TPA: MFS transporter [Solirubrobacteraceae bacterium]